MDGDEKTEEVWA